MYSSPLAASSAIWTLKIHESDEHPGRNNKKKRINNGKPCGGSIIRCSNKW
jgi:hypothetical protein